MSFEIVAIIVVLLVPALIYFKIQKKKLADTTPKNVVEATKPIQQEANTATDSVEPAKEKTAQLPESLASTQTAVASENKPLVTQTSDKSAYSEAETHKNLPQDSMLRRHYLSHLRAMITSGFPRPTDSMLSRHYNTHITAEIERYLNNENAMQQRVSHDENDRKKPIISVVNKNPTIITASPSIETIDEATTVSKIPEDSMLKRHYLTHLHTQVAANLLIRPTDSMLRRHYDTLLENSVKNS